MKVLIPKFFKKAVSKLLNFSIKSLNLVVLRKTYPFYLLNSITINQRLKSYEAILFTINLIFL